MLPVSHMVSTSISIRCIGRFIFAVWMKDMLDCILKMKTESLKLMFHKYLYTAGMQVL